MGSSSLTEKELPRASPIRTPFALLKTAMVGSAVSSSVLPSLLAPVQFKGPVVKGSERGCKRLLEVGSWSENKVAHPDRQREAVSPEIDLTV